MISERIKTRRVALKMTQAELAERLGVSPKTVSHWENGAREPDLITIRALAQVLETSMGYLIGDIDDPRPKPLDIERRGMPLPPPGAEYLTKEELEEIEERARAFEEFEIRRLLRKKGYDV